MFNCDKCGLCCRNLKSSDIYDDLDRGDGTCKYLRDDNLCSIYETRPDKCNVKKTYELFFKHIYTKDEFYKLNENACLILKKRNRRI